MQSIGTDRFVHSILAVDDERLHCKYAHPVSLVINAKNPSEYAKAARLLNHSKSSVVSLQHEYGIFGGDWGKHILEFTGSLEKPLVTTFHTVLGDLPQLARKVQVDLASKSKYVVVTIAKAEPRVIIEKYNVPADKVRMIYHTGRPSCFSAIAAWRKRSLD